MRRGFAVNESYVFYRSFHESAMAMAEAASGGDEAAKYALYGRMMAAASEYAFSGATPEEGGFVRAFFLSAKPQMDANRVRREKGANGGRPRRGVSREELVDKHSELGSWKDVADFYGVSESTVFRSVKTTVETEKNETVTGTVNDCQLSKPNENVNVNDNDNVNVNVNVNTGADKPPDTHRTRFKKPTEEEVRGYCRERGNGVDARRFCDFYESKGWRVGNQPMKDWRACVRTWERADRTRGSPVMDADVSGLIDNF